MNLATRRPRTFAFRSRLRASRFGGGGEIPGLSLLCTGAVALGAFALIACEGGPPTEPPPLQVRDSAGVAIVENEGALWSVQEGWRIGDDPILHVGAGAEGDPELQFARIVGVHRMADGGIAVVDRWTPAVSFFDASGALVGRFAQVGSGPGEFPGGRAGIIGGITRSFSCGADTVYVVLRQQIAAYTAPAEHVRTFSLEELGRIRGCSGDRILVQRTHTPWRTEPGIYVDSIVLASYDLEGMHRSVLDTLPGEERIYSTGPH